MSRNSAELPSSILEQPGLWERVPTAVGQTETVFKLSSKQNHSMILRLKLEAGTGPNSVSRANVTENTLNQAWEVAKL